jgi:hypothetical protein
MAKITSFRVTVNEGDKEIFYIIEKNNGALTIIPRHNLFFRDEFTSATTASPYIESRFSIHTSLNNPLGNTIHRTVITKSLSGEIMLDCIVFSA